MNRLSLLSCILVLFFCTYEHTLLSKNACAIRKEVTNSTDHTTTSAKFDCLTKMTKIKKEWGRTILVSVMVGVGLTGLIHAYCAFYPLLVKIFEKYLDNMHCENIKITFQNAILKNYANQSDQDMKYKNTMLGLQTKILKKYLEKIDYKNTMLSLQNQAFYNENIIQSVEDTLTLQQTNTAPDATSTVPEPA